MALARTIHNTASLRIDEVGEEGAIHTTLCETMRCANKHRRVGNRNHLVVSRSSDDTHGFALDIAAAPVKVPDSFDDSLDQVISGIDVRVVRSDSSQSRLTPEFGDC